MKACRMEIQLKKELQQQQPQPLKYPQKIIVNGLALFVNREMALKSIYAPFVVRRARGM